MEIRLSRFETLYWKTTVFDAIYDILKIEYNPWELAKCILMNIVFGVACKSCKHFVFDLYNRFFGFHIAFKVLII